MQCLSKALITLTLTATAATLADAAPVGRVVARPAAAVSIAIAALHVLPADVLVAPGAKLGFTAIATDGELRSSTPAGVVWKASGGTIAQDGTYTAGSSEGVFQVTATVAGRTAVARLRIAGSSGKSPRIQLKPVDRARVSLSGGWRDVDWSTIMNSYLVEATVAHAQAASYGIVIAYDQGSPTSMGKQPCKNGDHVLTGCSIAYETNRTCTNIHLELYDGAGKVIGRASLRK